MWLLTQCRINTECELSLPTKTSKFVWYTMNLNSFVVGLDYEREIHKNTCAAINCFTINLAF